MILFISHQEILLTGWFGLRFIEAEKKSIVSHCVFEYGVATANY